MISNLANFSSSTRRPALSNCTVIRWSGCEVSTDIIVPSPNLKWATRMPGLSSPDTCTPAVAGDVAEACFWGKLSVD